MIPKYRSDDFKSFDDLFQCFKNIDTGKLKKLLPLLKEHGVSQFFPKKYPEEIKADSELIQELSKIKNELLFNNLYYLNHLKQVLAHFEERKIDVVVLKGISLINHLYDDISMRTFVDFDFLIHEKDKIKFINELANLGFTPDFGSGDQETSIKFTAYNEKIKISIDIVTRLNANPYTDRYFKLDNDLIWSRKEIISYDDINAYRLSKEDEFLYAIYHLAFHLNFEIDVKWIFDLYYYVEKYEDSLDQNYIIEQIQKTGLEHIMISISAILNWAFDKELSFLTFTGAANYNLLQHTWMQYYVYPPRLFGILAYKKNLSKRMLTTLFKLALLYGSRKKMKFITDRFFPDADRVKTAYTKRLFLGPKSFFYLMRSIYSIFFPVLLSIGFLYYLILTISVGLRLFKWRHFE